MIPAIFPFLKPVAIYGALAGALVLSGFWWGKLDALQDAEKAQRVIELKAAQDRAAADDRVRAAEARAKNERQRADVNARLLKAKDKEFSDWDDTRVPDAALDLVWGDVPAATTGGGPVADPPDRFPRAPVGGG